MMMVSPKSDNARIPYLTKCGHKVKVIWEHDIPNVKDYLKDWLSIESEVGS